MSTCVFCWICVCVSKIFHLFYTPFKCVCERDLFSFLWFHSLKMELIISHTQLSRLFGTCAPLCAASTHVILFIYRCTTLECNIWKMSDDEKTRKQKERKREIRERTHTLHIHTRTHKHTKNETEHYWRHESDGICKGRICSVSYTAIPWITKRKPEKYTYIDDRPSTILYQWRKQSHHQRYF